VRTAPFDASGKEVGLLFLEWLQEELEVLPTIVIGLMSFASLITCEGAVNSLSREGCRHFGVFDRSNEDFERGIFQVEDPVMKRSKQPLLTILILWRPQPLCLLITIYLVLNLGLFRLMVSLGVHSPGPRSLRMKTWIILLRLMWPRRSPRRGWRLVRCLIFPVRGPSAGDEGWCRSIALARVREVVGAVGWGWSGTAFE
jgi:hypothetical protein